MEFNDYRNAIADASELAIIKALVAVDKLPATINQVDAFKLYGPGKVRSWIEWGLIKRIKDGENNSEVRFDSVKLKEVALTANRIAYFNNK